MKKNKELKLEDNKVSTFKGNYIVFDVETTGFSHNDDDIIEIGAVKLDSNFNIIDRYQSFINLEKKNYVPKKITELTGITTADTKKGKYISTVLGEFVEFLGNHDENIIIAQNTKFDLGMINAKMIEHGLGFLNMLYFDTSALAKLLENKIDMVQNYGVTKLEKHNLAYLTQFFDAGYDGSSHHRADYDAEITANLLKILITTFQKNEISLTFKDVFLSRPSLKREEKFSNTENIEDARELYIGLRDMNLPIYGYNLLNYCYRSVIASSLKEIKS